MTYLSVCSGIEAATVAWEPLGFKPVGFAEIEPFPCELLKQKYPIVKNYGDITKYKEWDYGGKFDILVGGTPCQSFSIAGKRGGTNDIRGMLMYSYLDIVERYKPQWVIWENVPGVLSSGKGLDFASLLAGLEKCGYGWAYRVLDAQYFGVPQRRRRIFVIGHSDNRTDLAAKVLFEQKGVCRNNPQGREAEYYTAGRTESGTATMYLSCYSKSRIKAGTTADTVTARYGTGGGNTPLVLDSFFSVSKNKAGTLKATDYKTPPICFAGNTINRDTSGGNGTGFSMAKSYTVTASDIHVVAVNQTVRYLTPLECERLQGFPDNYTQIEWMDKPKEQCPDGHRYKAIGNSMAVPVMRWIGERIKKIQGEKYGNCENNK